MIWLLALLVVLALLILAWPYWVERNRKIMNDQARGAAPGKFVTLSQGETHYQWVGPVRGPVAVLVHGLTTPSFVWGGLAQGLAAQGYRVLIFDLYGRGYSDRIPGAQDSAFFSRQIADLLDHVEVQDDIHLVGYSMGGAIATCFAADNPGRIRQLTLLASAGVAKIPSKLYGYIRENVLIGNWMMLGLYPYQMRRGIKAEQDLPTTVPDIGDLQRGELEWQGFLPAVTESLRGILSRPLEEEHRKLHAAGVPVLAIWGQIDEVIPLSAVGVFSEWSRNAKQEVVQGAGHGLPYTHTDEVLELISQVGQEPR